MAYTREYPYVDSQIYNDDWLINKVRQLEVSVATFVASNGLKYASPLQWNIKTVYDVNTVVLAPDGNSYASLKIVPSGIVYTNEEYWVMIAQNNAQLESALQSLEDVYTDLLSAGIVIPAHAKIKLVGTTNYPTYKQALDSVEEGDFTLILIPPSVTDLVALYPTVDTPLIPGDTYIVGLGVRAHDCKFLAGFTSFTESYSAFNPQKNFGMYNISVEVSGARYAVHDDFGPEGFYKRRFVNCFFQGTLGLNYVIAGGIYGNCEVSYVNCEFISVNNLYCIGYHDKTDAKEGTPVINFDGCSFYSSGPKNVTQIMINKFTDYLMYLNIKNSNLLSAAIYSATPSVRIYCDHDIALYYTTDVECLCAPNMMRVQAYGLLTPGRACSVNGTISDCFGLIDGVSNAWFGITAKKDVREVGWIIPAGSICVSTMFGIQAPSTPSTLYANTDGTLSMVTGEYAIGYVMPTSFCKLYDYPHKTA